MSQSQSGIDAALEFYRQGRVVDAKRAARSSTQTAHHDDLLIVRVYHQARRPITRQITECARSATGSF
jgi:hypothetical protein